MRVLVANHHRALLGGIETYLAGVLPALARAGHDVLLLHEAEPEGGATPIPLPAGAASLNISTGSVERISEWKPDLVYLHDLRNLQLQERLITDYPTVAFAHGYYGLCISGKKTWSSFQVRPCAKKFDATCLLHFYPHRCGGLNPLRMLQDFSHQRKRLELLRRCGAVLTHGGQLHQEYLAQGLPAERVFAIPHFVPPPQAAPQRRQPSDEIQLAFAGRFEDSKGGKLLLFAALDVATKTGRSVRLDMVGSGPAEANWKRAAREITMAAEIEQAKLRIEFHGWVATDRKDAILAEADLVVVPSVWPEPFGQVGLEAAALGVPAVAFDVGGIFNWLRDGVNGYLAPANPPTAEGLAATIVKALGNPREYETMRVDAMKVAGEFSIDRHLDALLEVFKTVVKAR